MSQNNNDNSGVAFAFGIVVAVAYAMVVMAFFVLTFLTFVMTIICFFAWNRPLTLMGRWTLTPGEARSFVRRGLAGAFLLPAFLVFLELAFGVRINGEYLMHIVVGGYVLGSFGVEYLMTQMPPHADTAQGQTVIPPHQQIAPPPQAPEPPARPFRFASWNDEDGQ